MGSPTDEAIVSRSNGEKSICYTPGARESRTVPVSADDRRPKVVDTGDPRTWSDLGSGSSPGFGCGVFLVLRFRRGVV